MQSFHFWALAIAFLSCAACSTTDDGGNKRQPRGPIPPAPQTSLFFAIESPDAGPACATGRWAAFIGGPPKSSIGDPGTRAIDGYEFARIRCRVSGSGTFALTLSAERQGTSFSLNDGTVSGTSGQGTISVAGPGTQSEQLVSEAGACQLGLERPPFQVAPGHIWATFNCPSLRSASQPASQCNVLGEFVFENCEQQ